MSTYQTESENKIENIENFTCRKEGKGKTFLEHEISIDDFPQKVCKLKFSTFCDKGA